jgi:hypothetical protein
MLTLIINGLNHPIKRQRMANCIENQDLTICYLQEKYLGLVSWFNQKHAA